MQRKIRGLAAVGAAAALTFALAACSGGEEEAASAPETTAAAPAPASPEMAASDDGVTQTSDIVGPACDQVPTEGEGSAEGMVDDPVATAASNNPLLSTLVQAVGAVPGLADTLNAAEGITVLAPYDGAFEAVPADQLQALLDSPDQLAPILQYHVLDTRQDAAGLVEEGEITMLDGSTVTVGGTADAPTFTDATGATATTLCGNIPTANATVFVIDTVLMPGS
ncbi:MAG TPA: fasciclin domain-containing protein [Pseudonocardia sp.]|nr:fasciclin domain-containing protein [Pseudonocardia sp.]